ncbi:MAG: hypothetical protein EG826_06520 [Deltaproteobacteria bacterium]|nr:hypothetical protein [Deltaproteobacteria bacterium]
MENFRLAPRFCGAPGQRVYLAAAVFCLLILAGCVSSGKPSYSIERYLLNYTPPSFNNPARLPVFIKFNRFSSAAAYNTTSMIFRNDPYSLDSFNYSRWAVYPADMVGDDLLEDMRTSGLFQGVFSRYEADEGRFVLSGSVDEFYLRIDKDKKTAVIGISVSLQDTREKETGKRMMFQKKYAREEPLTDSSPRGYCQAASQAMQVVSRSIVSDVYAALQVAAK